MKYILLWIHLGANCWEDSRSFDQSSVQLGGVKYTGCNKYLVHSKHVTMLQAFLIQLVGQVSRLGYSDLSVTKQTGLCCTLTPLNSPLSHAQDTVVTLLKPTLESDIVLARAEAVLEKRNDQRKLWDLTLVRVAQRSRSAEAEAAVSQPCSSYPQPVPGHRGSFSSCSALFPQSVFHKYPCSYSRIDIFSHCCFFTFPLNHRLCEKQRPSLFPQYHVVPKQSSHVVCPRQNLHCLTHGGNLLSLDTHQLLTFFVVVSTCIYAIPALDQALCYAVVGQECHASCPQGHHVQLGPEIVT